MITGIVRQQQHRNQLDPTEDDCKRGESKAPGVVDAQTGDGERWDLPGKFPALALTGSHFSANRSLILYYYMRTEPRLWNRWKYLLVLNSMFQTLFN